MNQPPEPCERLSSALAEHHPLAKGLHFTK
jgi:hypothetical protein